MPCTGFTLFIGEDPAAVAGLTLLRCEAGLPYQFAFFHIQDERVRRNFVSLYRATAAALPAAKAGGIDVVYALLDADKPRAGEMLARLGFVPMTACEKTEFLFALEKRTNQQTWVKRL